MSSLVERGMIAAEKFLVRKGYEVLDSRDGFVVAMDDEALAFVKVRVREGDGFCDFDSSKSMRQEFECFALRWLLENKHVDVPIRFDELAMVVVGDDRALLRHHINCLN